LAVLQDRHALLDRVGEHGSIDVDDDLVAVAPRTWIESAREGRLRHQNQRVGAPLLTRQLIAGRLAAR
jgi:hypothetical protein